MNMYERKGMSFIHKTLCTATPFQGLLRFHHQKAIQACTQTTSSGDLEMVTSGALPQQSTHPLYTHLHLHAEHSVDAPESSCEWVSWQSAGPPSAQVPACKVHSD